MTTIAVDVDNVTLAQLIERVERGESIALTRGGQRLATLLPEPRDLTPEQRERDRILFDQIDAHRDELIAKGYKPGVAEIIAMRDAGRP